MTTDKPQAAPRYYGYWRYSNGGYAQITECESCHTVGLEEDCPTVECCKYCGGRVRGRYKSGMWIEPETTGHLWWKTITKPGYWLDAK